MKCASRPRLNIEGEKQIYDVNYDEAALVMDTGNLQIKIKYE